MKMKYFTKLDTVVREAFIDCFVESYLERDGDIFLKDAEDIRMSHPQQLREFFAVARYHDCCPYREDDDFPLFLTDLRASLERHDFNFYEESCTQGEFYGVMAYNYLCGVEWNEFGKKMLDEIEGYIIDLWPQKYMRSNGLDEIHPQRGDLSVDDYYEALDNPEHSKKLREINRQRH
jgi:hypothetical protein